MDRYSIRDYPFITPIFFAQTSPRESMFHSNVRKLQTILQPSNQYYQQWQVPTAALTISWQVLPQEHPERKEGDTSLTHPTMNIATYVKSSSMHTIEGRICNKNTDKTDRYSITDYPSITSPFFAQFFHRDGLGRT